MYRTILVPLDGSSFAERSLGLAAEIARACGSQIVLVRAVRAVQAAPPATGDAIAAQAAAVAAGDAYLAGIAARLATDGLVVQTATPYAPAAQGILLECELRGADLVVMCTHGRSGLGRWIFGSVAEAVLAQARMPVLLVRPTGAVPTLAPVSRPPRFLVPLDGSALAEAVLPHAAGLARAFAGDIQLLEVVLPASLREPILDEPLARTMIDADRLLAGDYHAAEAYLSDVATALVQRQAQGRTAGAPDAAGAVDDLCVDTLVRTGWPPDTILAQAREGGASLIVMATHGRTGLEAALLGSVTLEVIHHTLLPLLLLRVSAAR